MKAYKIILDNWLSYCVPYNWSSKKYPYSLDYALGKETKAADGTLGIFCFETLEAAREFSEGDFCMKILEVEGIGKHIYPEEICMYVTHERIHEFYNIGKRDLKPPPKGTICFKSIIPFRVVEER